jgi:PAS domain S-box-containing protein
MQVLPPSHPGTGGAHSGRWTAGRAPLLMATAIFLLSLAATFALWKSATSQAEQALRTDFEFQSRQTARLIERRMATYEQVARGVRAFLLGSMDVDRKNYRDFIASLMLQEKYPGIQGLALVKVINPDGLDKHVSDLRAQGFPEYRVHPAGAREVYSSIIQIEPFTGLNLRAFGFDMLTNPVRRAAMERARDTGRAAASGKVKLIQENGQREQNGLVMYMPVFRRGMPVETEAQRRAHLVGWVGAPFRMNDLMMGLGGERSEDIVLTIFDGDSVAPDAVLYHSLSENAGPRPSLFSTRQRIMVGGRPWTLDIRSGPSYEQRMENDKPFFIAAGGVLASFLLAVLVWALASGRRRAQVMAAGMTHKLRESEFRWKYALEGAGDGVWDWNNETGEIVYSKRWREMLGYGENEIANTTAEWSRLLHPEDAPRALAVTQEYVKGGQSAYFNQYRMRCRDGSWKWILSRGMAVAHDAEGRVTRTIGTHTDITDAKLQEAALRESNQNLATEQRRIRVILENLHDAFIAVGPDGLVTDWNARAEQIFGWTADEALGRDLAELIIPPEMRAAHRAGFARFAATGESKLFSSVIELPGLHRSGRIIPVELAIAGFPTSAGFAVSAFVRDISDRKEAERQEAERTEALEEARAALQHAQKLEAVGKLTGGVAHDFNNVLQIISGNIQLLQHRLGSDAEAGQRLGNMLSTVDRGAKLSSQLLAFARRQPLQPVVLNPIRVLHNMDDLLQRALGESIEFEVQAREPLWNTLVDRSQLENVILNLAINARDAMPDGGRLSISLGNATLDRQNSEVIPGDYVLLAMSDTGVGMTEDVREQAFEPFFTTKPAGEGTGLGLSMAYGFVKQSGGHIQLSSEPGKGTTVRIYLPRSVQPEIVLPASNQEFSVVGGTETILVVEDDLEVQSAVAGMLRELGYRVLTADSGDEALEIIKQGEKPDVLFTDVVMPKSLPSPQLAAEARKHIPDLAVLFTSGYTRNALISGGRLHEGVQLLSKPYRREQLAHRIRQVLAQRQRAA